MPSIFLYNSCSGPLKGSWPRFCRNLKADRLWSRCRAHLKLDSITGETFHMLDVALNDNASNASNSDCSTSDCVMRIFYFPKLLFKVFFFCKHCCQPCLCFGIISPLRFPSGQPQLLGDDLAAFLKSGNWNCEALYYEPEMCFFILHSTSIIWTLKVRD